MFFQKCSFLHHSFTEVHHIRLCNWSCNEERKTNLIMLAAAFLSCVRSSGSCITSSRKPITRIFSSVFSSKSWGNTQEWPQCYYTGLIVLLQKQKKKKKKRKESKFTCECLDTQWRSTFRTLFVAALRITNSLSPFLWSVGKPGIRVNTVGFLFLI